MNKLLTKTEINSYRILFILNSILLYIYGNYVYTLIFFDVAPQFGFDYIFFWGCNLLIIYFPCIVACYFLLGNIEKRKKKIEENKKAMNLYLK